ncbi:MAG TPA: EamA family transporter [Candidatus Angelobacter sp.]|nr:EamA family transporter [Candidatus Angelobacter sp.]
MQVEQVEAERQAKKHRLRVMVSFAVVYVLWGSTYLAMRVAVRDFPPFVVGTTRYLAAGPVVLAACAAMGRKIRITRHDFWRLLAIGVALLSVGNMGIVWGEKYVASSLAALVVALMPIWVVAIEAWGYRAARMTSRGFIGLGTGLGGLLVLLWPRIRGGTHLGHVELIGCGILAAGSMAWALGSVLSHRFHVSVDVFVSAGWQMTLGGIVNAIIASLSGQFQHVRWTRPAIESVAYLVVFGSWVGFSAFTWLLENVPTPKVATYTYVNPIVALFLGWLLLSEPVDGYMLAGAAIIIGSVVLVNTSRLKRLPGEHDSSLAPANPGVD